MTIRKLLQLFTCTATILISCLANADGLKFYIENDSPFNDDSDYTNGARIDYQHGNWTFFLTQLMYSPEDITINWYEDGTHPYAGYLGIGAGYTDYNQLDGRSAWINYFELQSGVIGEYSIAENTQKVVHKMLSCHAPKGWDYQLHNEFEIQGVYAGGYEFVILGRRTGWNLRSYAEITGYAGTMQVAAGADMDLKLGYRTIKHRRASEIEIRDVEPGNSFYILAGLEGRAWAWNVFLDGNRDGDSESVDKKTFTGAYKLGIGAELDGVSIDIFMLYKTREYDTQNHTPNYASASIGFRF